MTQPPGGSDEGALVGRIAMGDELAFASAYDRHAGLVFGAVVRLLGDREAAAEVVQDTFLALWRRAAQFDAAAGSLSGWLLAIARNRAIDRHRAETRRAASRSIPVSTLLGDEGGEAGTADELPLGWIAGQDRQAGAGLVADGEPEMIADRRWAQATVRTLVSQLPEVERSVVVLAYGGGLSQSEVADRLGAPIGTVKSRTRRALARLRDSLVQVPGLLEAGDTSAPPESGHTS
jgi:RNA polymerase sigma-70 factor (ECF subfamily)